MSSGRRQGHAPLAPTSIEEQELTTREDRQTGLTYVCSTWPSRTRRLTKRYGPSSKVSVDRDGRVTASHWELPGRPVSLRIPRKPGSGNPAALARARAAKKKGSRTENL
jgi:hypothetical protein